jgi:uncharacterized glyoxalase superfamily protein PhnB
VIANRSVPTATVIPVVAYPNVAEAADWLVHAFGFKVRLRIADHRVQLVFGDGAVVLTGGGGESGVVVTHSVLVRVDDVDSHHEQAVQHGARILSPPTDYSYGERQYTAEDGGGHHWTFSQSIADVDPVDWGGVLVEDAMG